MAPRAPPVITVHYRGAQTSSSDAVPKRHRRVSRLGQPLCTSGRSPSHARCCFPAFPMWDFGLQRGDRGPCPRLYVLCAGSWAWRAPKSRVCGVTHTEHPGEAPAPSQHAFSVVCKAWRSYLPVLWVFPLKGEQPKAVRVSSCDYDLLAERSRAAATWTLPCPCSQPAAASRGPARGCCGARRHLQGAAAPPELQEKGGPGVAGRQGVRESHVRGSPPSLASWEISGWILKVISCWCCSVGVKDAGNRH